MASIALYLDRTSMDGKARLGGIICFAGYWIKLNVGFSTMPFVLYSLTSFFCIATLTSVEKNVLHAIGYMLLAHLANLVQLLLWEAELIMRSKNSHVEASTELSVDLTSQNCKIKFTPSFILRRSITLFCVSIVPYMSAAFIIKKNILMAFGLLFIGIRSNLAIARFWLSPAVVKSTWFNNLVLLTGLKLCEEISLQDVNSNKSDKKELSEEEMKEDERKYGKNDQKKGAEVKGLKDEGSKVDYCSQLGDDEWEDLNSASFYEEGC